MSSNVINRARIKIQLVIAEAFYKLSDASVRNLSEQLGALAGTYAGKRCFIMGSGPSLNQMDLSLLADDYVWGTNKIFLLFDRINWRPAFYTAVDKRVVPDIRDEINHLVRSLPDTNFFFPVNFRYRRHIRSHPNLWWFDEKHPAEMNPPQKPFSTNAAEWVSSVRTVTITALQLAVHLGFNPIYLIGCDTTYSIPSTVKRDQNNPSLLTSTRDDDPNHFVRNYFGKTSQWHVPNVALMVAHYIEAKAVCDKLKIEVINATRGGNLEVFPRIQFEALF